MQRIVRMRNILRKQVALRMQDIKRKTEQIELQNVQMKLQRDAATRQRSEAEQQRAGLEKRLSILLAKIQKNDDLIHDLKQRTVSLNKDKLLLKRKVDLYENNVRDVVFKILLPSEKEFRHSRTFFWIFRTLRLSLSFVRQKYGIAEQMS